MSVTPAESERRAEREAPRDFIREIVAHDLATGKHERVATRFPPEPNGYLHIGHAKSLVLNFGVAREFGGTCNLRFDDTNPETEDMEYVEAIRRDVAWLGYEWDGLFHASDYFDRLYALAEGLIEDGKAYVDSLSEEEIREYRGTVGEPGRESPYRERSVEENLDLFRRMRDGEFPDGSHVLRAKIDMASKNMLMRDPVLYRIRHADHYRTGGRWCVYPLYDFTHCLSDSFEGITHSLCTLEFENNRELYDWVVANARVDWEPRQIEFARLNLSYTVLSKRRLIELVEGGHVAGWDDPRMPTLSGLRRRGVPPEAIREFCERVGVARTHNVIDVALLEFAVRDELNRRAPRRLGVLRPLKVVLTNYPEGETETFEAPDFPPDVPGEGTRRIPFSRELWIERDDFAKDPPPGFHRLAPGREVRLRYAYVVRCEEAIEDANGEVVELRCTYDPATRGGSTPDEREVKGTIHWVSADDAIEAEVRLYDRLFSHEDPVAADGDFKEYLNPDSLEVLRGCRVEPSLAGAEPGDRFQLERLGYFVVDPDTRPGALVLNRTVTLRDTWAKLAGDEKSAEREAAAARRAAEKAARKERQRRESRASEPELEPLEGAAAERFRRYRDELGLGERDAHLLASSDELSTFFEDAVAAHDQPQVIANWIVNELLRELKGRELHELPVSPGGLAELVALVGAGTITGAVAKEVFAEMVEKGGAPRAIVEARGLEQLGAEDELASHVDAALDAHPEQAERYREGKTALLGFFVGQVMRATRGRADPKVVRRLLQTRLDG